MTDHPEDAYFHELRGQILFENGRIGEAVESYQRAVDLDPGEPLLRLGLAQSQLETERPDQVKPALAHLEEVVRREPRNSFAWRLLAIAYGRTDQIGMTALALGESALARGNAAEAKAQADRAMHILPENSPAWIRAQDIKRAARRLEEG